MPKRNAPTTSGGRGTTVSARAPPPVGRRKVVTVRSDKTDRGGGTPTSRELVTSRTAYFDSITNPLVAPPTPAPVNCRRAHVARFQEYIDVTNDTDQPIDGKFIVVPDVDAPLIYSGPGVVRVARPPDDAAERLSKSARRHLRVLRTGRDRVSRARMQRRAGHGHSAALTPSAEVFDVSWYYEGTAAVTSCYQSLGLLSSSGGDHAWYPGYCATLWNPARAPNGVAPPTGVSPPGSGMFSLAGLVNLLELAPNAFAWSISFSRSGAIYYRYYALDADRNVLYDPGTVTSGPAPTMQTVTGSATVSGTPVKYVVFLFGNTTVSQPPSGMSFAIEGFVRDNTPEPPAPPLPPYDPDSTEDYSIELSGYLETADAFDAVRNESAMVTATYTGSTLSNAGQIATVQMPYAQLTGYGDFPGVAAIREVQGSYSGPLKHGCNTVTRPSIANLEWRGLQEVAPDDADPYDWSQLPTVVSAFEGLEPGQSIRIRYVAVWSFETRVQIFCPRTLPVDQPSFQAAVATMSRLPNSTANGTHGDYWRDVAKRYTTAASKYVMSDPVSFATTVVKGLSMIAAV